MNTSDWIIFTFLIFLVCCVWEIGRRICRWGYRTRSALRTTCAACRHGDHEQPLRHGDSCDCVCHLVCS